MFNHYFNVIHNVAIHPITGEIFFNDTWESLRMASRKRYRGEYDPDIQSYNPKTGEYKNYTKWNGKDMWATIDKNGTLYYVSDEQNGEYNLCTLVNGEPKALTKFKTSVIHPSVSADGSLLVFEKDYQLYVYDPLPDKSRKLKISIIRNTLLPEEQSFKVDSKISYFDVSPDNKKMAFVSRGDLFVSDIKGKFIRKIERGGVFEKAQEVKWMSDNKTLLFNQTREGYTNWFTIAADGKSKIRQVTKDLRNNRALTINPDMTKGAYLSGRDEIRLIDLKNFKSENLVNDEFWGFQNGLPDFSPDGKWLTYTAKHEFEDDVLVINLESKKKKTPKIKININTDRIWERMERVSPGFSSQGGATLIRQGKKDIILYSSNHDKGISAIWKTTMEPFEKTKTEKIAGLTGRARILIRKDKAYALAGGSIYTINIAGNKATKVNVSYSFARNLQEEFNQMFAQTWSNMEENYYSENLHGENWVAFKKYYKQFLPYLNNRGDLRTLLNDLLGELNSSHMGFNTRGAEETTALKYVSLEPGILYRQDHPYIVDRIVTRSAADKKAVDILPGDELIAVDGTTVDHNMPRDYYFYRPGREQEML
ncbi:MAG: PD40 domain-containing protein, partial [Bacteroidales bacterium]|nr:PD40 domain-containing protein [Bacteroidales bacterium]